MAKKELRKVAIYGSGMLGLQVYHMLKSYLLDKYQIVGFVDDTKPVGVEIIENLKNLGSIRDMASSREFSSRDTSLIMAIGYNNLAKKLCAFENAKNHKYDFETIIHPKAFIETGVKLGEGNIFLPGVCIDKYVELGNINYFDMGCIVGEDSIVGNSNYISAGSTIGGYVKMGNANFIGLDSTLLSEIKLGSYNFINARTFLTDNIDDCNKVIEAPRVKIQKIGSKYNS